MLCRGWEYELFIRLAERAVVACIVDERLLEEWASSSDFYTDAYIVSRYAKPLQECRCLDVFLESCVETANHLDDTASAIAYLQGMLSKNDAYWELYQATQPFLLLLGDAACYNVLNDMAKNLAKGLRLCGKNVEICDLSGRDPEKIMRLLGKRYQAVIGFQHQFFEIYLKERGCYLADCMYGPKLQMIFDHPYGFYEQFLHHGADYYVLTHDENYLEYVRQYAPSVCGSFLLPPAGDMPEKWNMPRDLDVVFLGSYHNYRDIVNELYRCDRNTRHMAARYLRYLKKWVNQPAEFAFSKMLEDYGMEVEPQQFIEMMYRMGNVCQCMIFYYREKIIRTLLDGEIALHVYGESWKSSPLADSAYLICQEAVAAECAGQILQRAKVSLNILSWHKGGCNERIINSMLSEAAVVTDASSYLRKHFEDGKELCYYDLERLEELPRTIRSLVCKETKRRRIAAAGRRKAETEYSILAQAKRIVNILRQIHAARP